MIELFALAFGAASLSNFLDDCLQPEMIFGRYGDLVRSLGFWGKPLGGCLICMNVWVSLAVFVIFTQPCEWIDLGIAILFIGVSNTILKFIIR